MTTPAEPAGFDPFAEYEPAAPADPPAPGPFTPMTPPVRRPSAAGAAGPTGGPVPPDLGRRRIPSLPVRVVAQRVRARRAVPNAASSAPPAGAGPVLGAATAKRERDGDAATGLPVRRRLRVLRVAGTVLVAVSLVAASRAFAVDTYQVGTESMQATLEPGDRVFVEKLSYTAGSPRRGDVIVFDGQGVVDPVGRGTAQRVQRVVAVAGDVVECCDDQGRVVVNGSPRWEPYVVDDDQRTFGPFVIPDGHVWVLGDHRAVSSDSRDHGAVPVTSVRGRVVARYWPLTRPALFTGR